MDWLLDGFFDWIKQGLIEAIMARFAGLYDTINTQVGSIAGNVGQTPGDWNPSVFAMIRTLSETAVLPIAGMILTFVLCYELIQTIIEKNNMHEFDVFNLYKWIFSATRSYTNTIPQAQTLWAIRPSGAKNRGFSTCEKTTTDTLMSGMMG